MSRAGKAFQLGAVIVPIHAALGLSQRIEPMGGNTTLRLGLGAGIKQSVWRKKRITLSANGWCPPGLGSLNFDAALALKCGLPDSLTSTSHIITLPAARRVDAGYEPFARAHLTDGWQDTPMTLAGNVATCATVAGAVGYSVWYYPELSVLCEPPAVDFDGQGAAVAWELICEET